MAQKRFHRHFETPGVPLYWIIIAYIILGWFYPVIGLLALICMIYLQLGCSKEGAVT